MNRRNFLKFSLSAVAIAALPPGILQRPDDIWPAMVKVFPAIQDRLYIGLLSPDKKELPFERQRVTFRPTQGGKIVNDAHIDMGEPSQDCKVAYVALYENFDSPDYLILGRVYLNTPHVMTGQPVLLTNIPIGFRRSHRSG